MDILDKDFQQAQSGGGQVCQIAFYGGYMVFASGVAPRERTFVYANEAEKSAAKAKAEALAPKHPKADGSPAGVQQTAVMVQYRDSVLNQEVTWQDDRFHTYGPAWRSNPTYGFILGKKAELSIPTGKKVWARVSWATDPSAEANQDKDWAWDEYQGEKRLKTIAFPAEVYANKADAEKAAEGLAVEGTLDPTFPGEHTGWSPTDWQGMKEEIVTEFQKLASEIKGPPNVTKAKLEEAQVAVCEQYVITTPDGEPDVEKLRLLLAEAAV